MRWPMHKNLQKNPAKRPDNCCWRGTNVVESQHSVLHHTLAGGNNSPAHAGAILEQRAGRLSADAGVKYNDQPQLPHYNYSLLRSVNDQRKVWGLQPKYEGVPNPPRTQEAFNFEYMAADLLGGERSRVMGLRGFCEMLCSMLGIVLTVVAFRFSAWHCQECDQRAGLRERYSN